jgi:hypothetical protein
MIKNEGRFDRGLRLLIGIVLVILATNTFQGFWKWLAYLVAFIAIVTSFTGYCPLYEVLGCCKTAKSSPKAKKGKKSK